MFLIFNYTMEINENTEDKKDDNIYLNNLYDIIKNNSIDSNEKLNLLVNNVIDIEFNKSCELQKQIFILEENKRQNLITINNLNDLNSAANQSIETFRNNQLVLEEENNKLKSLLIIKEDKSNELFEKNKELVKNINIMELNLQNKILEENNNVILIDSLNKQIDLLNFKLSNTMNNSDSYSKEKLLETQLDSYKNQEILLKQEILTHKTKLDLQYIESKEKTERAVSDMLNYKCLNNVLKDELKRREIEIEELLDEIYELNNNKNDKDKEITACKEIISLMSTSSEFSKINSVVNIIKDIKELEEEVNCYNVNNENNTLNNEKRIKNSNYEKFDNCINELKCLIDLDNYNTSFNNDHNNNNNNKKVKRYDNLTVDKTINIESSNQNNSIKCLDNNKNIQNNYRLNYNKEQVLNVINKLKEIYTSLLISNKVIINNYSINKEFKEENNKLVFKNKVLYSSTENLNKKIEDLNMQIKELNEKYLYNIKDENNKLKTEIKTLKELNNNYRESNKLLLFKIKYTSSNYNLLNKSNDTSNYNNIDNDYFFNYNNSVCFKDDYSKLIYESVSSLEDNFNKLLKTKYEYDTISNNNDILLINKNEFVKHKNLYEEEFNKQIDIYKTKLLNLEEENNCLQNKNNLLNDFKNKIIYSDNINNHDTLNEDFDNDLLKKKLSFNINIKKLENENSFLKSKLKELEDKNKENLDKIKLYIEKDLNNSKELLNSNNTIECLNKSIVNKDNIIKKLEFENKLCIETNNKVKINFETVNQNLNNYIKKIEDTIVDSINSQKIKYNEYCNNLDNVINNVSLIKNNINNNKCKNNNNNNLISESNINKNNELINNLYKENIKLNKQVQCLKTQISLYLSEKDTFDVTKNNKIISKTNSSDNIVEIDNNINSINKEPNLLGIKRLNTENNNYLMDAYKIIDSKDNKIKELEEQLNLFKLKLEDNSNEIDNLVNLNLNYSKEEDKINKTSKISLIPLKDSNNKEYFNSFNFIKVYNKRVNQLNNEKLNIVKQLVDEKEEKNKLYDKYEDIKHLYKLSEIKLTKSKLDYENLSISLNIKNKEIDNKNNQIASYISALNNKSKLIEELTNKSTNNSKDINADNSLPTTLDNKLFIAKLEQDFYILSNNNTKQQPIFSNVESSEEKTNNLNNININSNNQYLSILYSSTVKFNKIIDFLISKQTELDNENIKLKQSTYDLETIKKNNSLKLFNLETNNKKLLNDICLLKDSVKTINEESDNKISQNISTLFSYFRNTLYEATNVINSLEANLNKLKEESLVEELNKKLNKKEELYNNTVANYNNCKKQINDIITKFENNNKNKRHKDKIVMSIIEQIKKKL